MTPCNDEGGAMAILSNRATQRKIYLRTHHVFGRSNSADTFLENLDASQVHASISWIAGAWELRDHSRNGSVLDGVVLHHSLGLGFKVGSVIEFGRDRGAAWLVEDLSAPTNLLWPRGHEAAPIALASSNLLPREGATELAIDCNERGQWICTGPQTSWVLEDGDEVRFAGKRWCFIMATEGTSTLQGNESMASVLSAPCTLSFTVSLDEEHVWLALADDRQQLDLGERSHHYTLLTLARLRLADAKRQLDSRAQGWVELESLAKMLGIDPGHLNIQIFRLRKQLALALPCSSRLPELVERRRGSLRFGNLRFSIVRGVKLEANFDPFAQGCNTEALAA